MKKIRFIAILLTICFFYSGCTKDNPILKEVEDVCEQMDDIKFMKHCYSKYDANSDGKVSMIEAAAVKEIYVGGMSITSLNGIEYFTNLEVLHCSTNELTSLDVSKNVKLTELRCNSNNLATLDVSKNVALALLNCSINELTSLDVSKNVAITELVCNANLLTSLDVSKNVNLKYLNCLNETLEIIYINIKHKDNIPKSWDLPRNAKIEYR